LRPAGIIMMKLRSFEIDGVLLIEPKRLYDLRGYSCETYSAAMLAQHGIEAEFVQDHSSLATAQGTLRGLRFQAPPMAQALLIRVVRGAIFAVALDIRGGSPTFGKHVSAELTAENSLQLYVPAGFAHGFATLRPLTETAVKHSAPISLEHSQGVFWDDPTLRIRWPLRSDEAVLSPNDEVLPLLREIESPFRYCAPESGVAA
jgi:dTDP-4-dehydrorhamnose 3,5-epimerase